MDYNKHYNLLINRGKLRKINGYYETHHIIPRCRGGTDSIENLVKLTPEEHYLAHQLLVKIFPNDEKLLSAALFMTASHKGNKVYGWLKRKWSKKMSINNPNKNGKARLEYIKKYGVPDRNWCITDKGRKILSDKMIKNNPMKNKLPWEHSRKTTFSIEIWKNADVYYNWWINNQDKSYTRMAKAFGYKNYAMSHINLIRKFRSGWIPFEDNKWLEFKFGKNIKNVSL